MTDLLTAAKHLGCHNCLFREKSKCVWLDLSIGRTPSCGGHHWMERPDHMYVPPEDRVFPHQLEDMPQKERQAVEKAMTEVKEKTLTKMAAFLHRLELAEMAQAQTRVFKMWFRNFLDGILGQVATVPTTSFSQTDASEQTKVQPKQWHDNLYWLKHTQLSGRGLGRTA